jgi:mono/diheme cytochrome c family protein
MVPSPLRSLLVLAVVAALACGGKGESAGQPAAGASAGADDLTPFQLENGIGPVTEAMTLPAEIDAAMAEAGKTVFQQKCSACHKMGEKYVGPALGEVTTRRTPAFVMNMILNPQENIERHPVVKQMVQETMSFMANQGLTQDQARQVLEYLRTQSTQAPK